MKLVILLCLKAHKVKQVKWALDVYTKLPTHTSSFPINQKIVQVADVQDSQKQHFLWNKLFWGFSEADNVQDALKASGLCKSRISIIRVAQSSTS